MTGPFASAAFAEQRRQRLLVEARQHRLLGVGRRRRRYELVRRLWPVDALHHQHGRDKSQPLRTRQLT